MKKNNLKTITLSLLTLLLLFACSNENESGQIKSKEFSLEFYQKNKSSLTSFLNSSKLQKRMYSAKSYDKEKVAEGILDEINQEYGTSLNLNQMDMDVLSENNLGSNWKDFYVKNGYITIAKAELLDQFGNDASTYDFEVAVENFRNAILKMNLNNREFEEYNLLVNSLYLLNDLIEENNNSSKSNFYAKDAPSWWGAAGCSVAIAANAVSTYALTACAIPNPATPAACTTAVVAKAFSFAGIIFGCSYL